MLMKKLLLPVVTVIALSGVAKADQPHHIECYGYFEYKPVHDFKDPELRDGRATLETNTFPDQDERCGLNLYTKNLKKVEKVCQKGRMCHVTGWAYDSRWLRIEKVENDLESNEK